MQFRAARHYRGHPSSRLECFDRSINIMYMSVNLKETTKTAAAVIQNIKFIVMIIGECDGECELLPKSWFFKGTFALACF